ncbi:Cell division protein FtsL [bacterium HR08]|nr:Cell division protein FtsL [bacterium HR08]
MTRHVRVPNAQVPHRTDQRAGHRVALVLGIVGLVALSLIVATWQHVEALRYGYRLNQLVRERERLEALKRQLESERAYYRSPQVIEPLARRLGLIRPDPSQVIVIGKGVSPRPSREIEPHGVSAMGFEKATGEHDPSLPLPRPRGEARSDGVRTARRPPRARSVVPSGDGAGAERASPAGGPHAGHGAAAESEGGSAVKEPDASGGTLSPERSNVSTGNASSEDAAPKRRRPSKQGEP